MAAQRDLLRRCGGRWISSGARLLEVNTVTMAGLIRFRSSAFAGETRRRADLLACRKGLCRARGLPKVNLQVPGTGVIYFTEKPYRVEQRTSMGKVLGDVSACECTTRADAKTIKRVVNGVEALTVVHRRLLIAACQRTAQGKVALPAPGEGQSLHGLSSWSCTSPESQRRIGMPAVLHQHAIADGSAMPVRR